MFEVDGAGQRGINQGVAAAIVDVFVYVVVLNLFIEYVPEVISETFTLSLLTAVLLKIVLEVVVLAKDRVKARYRLAGTPSGKSRRRTPAMGRAVREQVRCPGVDRPGVRKPRQPRADSSP